MSKSVSAKGNLVVARKLKAAGFANLLDAQPEIKKRFHQLWYDKTSLTESRRLLLEEFPDGHIPSIQQLSVYVKRHLAGSPVPTDLPQYTEQMQKVDSISTVYQGVEWLKELALKARNGNARIETQRRVIEALITKSATLVELEGKLGLREVHIPGITVNQQNNTFNVGGDDAEQSTEDATSIDRLIAIRQQIEADQRAGKVVEGEVVSGDDTDEQQRIPDSI